MFGIANRMKDHSQFIAHSEDISLRSLGHLVKPLWALLPVYLLMGPGISPAWAAKSSVPVAADGQAQAVIVVGEAAGEGAKYAAAELKKYLYDLSGAEIPIVTDQQGLPRSVSAILIGGPDQNRLVKRAMGGDRGKFPGLKTGAFILMTRRLDKRPVVIAGGKDDASTMYAVFDLVEQLGVTFRLTGDIVPQRRSSLEIPAMNLTRTPAVARRGFLLEATMHPSITMLSYRDYVRLLDQMAKMKFNYLEFWWFPYEPWLNYSYKGEEKGMGDVSTRVSAYMNTMYNGYGSRTTDDVSIGKHWFPSRRMVAPELQQAETPDQAYAAAQDLLRRVIHYANGRHVKVWLVDEMSSLPPNLGRYGERIGELPFQGVFGTLMHPLDPVNRQIQANRLEAMIRTYPEAEGYYLNFSEVYYPQNNAKHHDFYVEQEPKFQELDSLRAPWIDWQHVGGQAMIDSNIGYFDLFKYLSAVRDKFSSQTKLGVMTVGRGYVMPLFNKMLPKDVPFTDFDSGGRCGWTPGGMPMSYFGGMGERMRIDTPYADDDCDIIGLQFNVGVYTNKDHIFSDGVKYGLTGVAPWLIQPRGTEANTTFLSEAAWDPQLTMEQFYKDYSARLFGPDAAPDMYQAFMTLEDNQAYLAKVIRPPVTTMGCCGGGQDANMVYEYSLQTDPFDGPRGKRWKWYVGHLPPGIAYFQGSIPFLNKALDSMRAAQSKVAPRGRHELAYLICRTEAYRDAMRASIAEHQSLIAFDQAFQKRDSVSYQQFVANLEASLKQFKEAHRLAQVAATEYAEIVDYPSDLEALYHLNASTVLAYDLIDQWMEKIVDFHEGKPYAGRVPFERLFTGDVRIGSDVQNIM